MKYFVNSKSNLTTNITHEAEGFLNRDSDQPCSWFDEAILPISRLLCYWHLLSDFSAYLASADLAADIIYK